MCGRFRDRMLALPPHALTRWPANRVARATYPDGEPVTTGYGPHGLPVSLAGTGTYVSAAT